MSFYYESFLIGLLGSFHCIGMCGPIVLIVAKKNNPINNLIYQFGRVVTYSIMGIIFGFVGRGFHLAGMQKTVSIISGVLIILFVIFPKVNNSLFEKISDFIKPKLGSLMQNKTVGSSFFIGLLNGLLPCGLVYIALFHALSSSNYLEGGISMLFFGLGTLPIMFLSVQIISKLNLSIRNKINKILPIVTIVIGMLLIVRGLGLKIPYLSPPDKALQINEAPAKCH